LRFSPAIIAERTQHNFDTDHGKGLE
jgi:hypothetical protein